MSSKTKEVFDDEFYCRNPVARAVMLHVEDFVTLGVPFEEYANGVPGHDGAMGQQLEFTRFHTRLFREGAIEIKGEADDFEIVFTHIRQAYVAFCDSIDPFVLDCRQQLGLEIGPGLFGGDRKNPSSRANVKNGDNYKRKGQQNRCNGRKGLYCRSILLQEVHDCDLSSARRRKPSLVCDFAMAAFGVQT
jgi:hypothetical protein